MKIKTDDMQIDVEAYLSGHRSWHLATPGQIAKGYEIQALEEAEAEAIKRSSHE